MMMRVGACLLDTGSRSLITDADTHIPVQQDPGGELADIESHVEEAMKPDQIPRKQRC